MWFLSICTPMSICTLLNVVKVDKANTCNSHCVVWHSCVSLSGLTIMTGEAYLEGCKIVARTGESFMNLGSDRAKICMTKISQEFFACLITWMCRKGMADNGVTIISFVYSKYIQKTTSSHVHRCIQKTRRFLNDFPTRAWTAATPATTKKWVNAICYFFYENKTVTGITAEYTE